MNATTVDEVREEIRGWIEFVLNGEGGESVPVVVSQGDGEPSVPDPSAPYVVITSRPTRRRIGREQVGAVDDLGTQRIVNDYEDLWTLVEVNGAGDRLRRLVESQDRQDVRDRFRAVNLAYRGEGSDIVETSERVGGQWRYKHAVDIRIGLVSVATYQPGYIETVQYKGTVGGKTI